MDKILQLFKNNLRDRKRLSLIGIVSLGFLLLFIGIFGMQLNQKSPTANSMNASKSIDEASSPAVSQVYQNYEFQKFDFTQPKTVSQTNVNPSKDNSYSEWKDESILKLYQGDGPYASFNPQDEVISKRTESSKTFDNHNGTYTLVATSGAAHYQEDGVWKTTTNSLLPVTFAGYSFGNTDNKVKTYYGNTNQGIAFFENQRNEVAKYRVSKMNLYDANKKELKSIESYKNTQPVQKSDADNIVKYELNSNTHFSVEQQTGSIKSQYTINQNVFASYPHDAYVGFEELLTFQEATQASDYTVSIGKVVPGTKNKALTIVNHKGKALLKYADLMYFSKEKSQDKEQADYLIEKVDDYTYKLTMLVPVSWLQDESTQYPVVIDPFISAVPDNASNWSGFTDGNMYKQGDLIECGNWVGHEQHHGFAMFNINALPTNNECIQSVKLKMYQDHYLQGNDHNLKFDIGWANTDPRPDSRTTIMNAIANMEQYYRYDVYATPAACATCKGGADYDETTNGWKDFDIDYDLARNRIKTQRASKNFITMGMHLIDFSTTSTNIIYWRQHSSNERPQLIIVYATDNSNLNANVTTVNSTTCGGDGTITVNPTSDVATTWFEGYYGNSGTYGSHSIYGNASYHTDGYLKLIDIGGNQQKGALKIENPQNLNASAIQLEFNFYAQPQNNSGGDGWSITYAGDIPASPVGTQNGLSTTGLVIKFLEWTGSSSTCKNAVSVWYNNQQVGSCALNNSAWIGATWRKVTLSINTANQLTLSIGSNTAFSNLQLPSGYASQDKTGWEVAIGGTGGGMNENYSLQNISLAAYNQYQYSIDNGVTWQTSNVFTKKAGNYSIIMKARDLASICQPQTTLSATLTDPAKPVITLQPINTALCENKSGQLQVATSVSAPAYQWQIFNNDAWQNIDNSIGANGYTTSTLSFANAPASINNKLVRCVITENNCVTNSDSATIQVDEQPSANANLNDLYLCDLSAEIEATQITSGATISWNRIQGSGNASAIGNILNVSGLTSGANTDYQLLVSKGACQNIESDTVSISVPNLENDVTTTNNDNSDCIIQNGDNYNIYGNLSGKLIGELEDLTSNPQALQNTKVTVRLEPAVPTILTNLGDNQPYLQRSVAITPANNGSTRVRIYFTQAEYNNLKTYCTGTPYEFNSVQDLLVTKAEGVFPVQGNAALNAQLLSNVTFGNFGNDYYAEFEVNDFSTFYIHPKNVLGNSTTLPIELISFTGYYQNGVNVLNWKTASEKNTDKFIVERSQDSKSWEVIGEHPAQGFSNTTVEYSLVDKNPMFGNNFYRLKTLDQDQTFEYSHIINVSVTESTQMINGIVQVYPNPSVGLFNVKIQSAKNYKASIEVFSVQGQRLKVIDQDIVQGDNLLQLDLKSLPQGVYILTTVNAGGFRSEKKIIKN